MNESTSILQCHALTKRFKQGEIDVTVLKGVRNMPLSGSKYWVTERVAICPASRSFR